MAAASPFVPDISSDPLEDTGIEQFLDKEGKPKRPSNAFLLFGQIRRKELGQELKGTTSNTTGNVSKILSKEWEDPKLKAYYAKKADKIRDLHKHYFPDYVYTRCKNGVGKKGRGKGGKGKGKGKARALEVPASQINTTGNRHQYNSHQPAMQIYMPPALGQFGPAYQQAILQSQYGNPLAAPNFFSYGNQYAGPSTFLPENLQQQSMAMNPVFATPQDNLWNLNIDFMIDPTLIESPPSVQQAQQADELNDNFEDQFMNDQFNLAYFGGQLINPMGA